jgi:hypothetical protein
MSQVSEILDYLKIILSVSDDISQINFDFLCVLCGKDSSVNELEKKIEKR